MEVKRTFHFPTRFDPATCAAPTACRVPLLPVHSSRLRLSASNMITETFITTEILYLDRGENFRQEISFRDH
jgi:hypothetical protein